ncbi:outer membrane lipid asymmetry maintenance protein MlaD [Palleronia sp. KMU-117]|uniref:outer membrane lipid asymmetry maintenance protein MlaD n=1 Tax=Palleronia sp. KMU-117 TaxID=3434108 RepID=UPI003D726ACF
MTDHTTEVVVGAAVVAAAAGFILYAVQFAGVGGPQGDDYFLTASFRSVEGIAVGTDVRLGGVKVGTVTDLTLNPATFRADTTFTIDGALQLPEDTAVVISSEGLLGGNFVELLPGGSPFNLEPGSEIEDTQSSVSLVQLLLRFVTGSEDG